jgi:hypothetical protein
MADFTVVDSKNQQIITEYSNIAELAELLKRKCTARGFNIDNDTAVDEIMDAIRAVNERRRFKPTETELFEEKYDSLIVRLSICAIAKYGAEGQTSHSENGISRGYDGGSTYPKALLQEIVPLAGSPE